MKKVFFFLLFLVFGVSGVALGHLYEGAHTVICTWCPAGSTTCEECLRDNTHGNGCVYDAFVSSQSWGMAPDANCPPGTTTGTCQHFGFTNTVTGHYVDIPWPTGYNDRCCTFDPPLPGQVPRPAAVRKAAELRLVPQPKSMPEEGTK